MLLRGPKNAREAVKHFGKAPGQSLILSMVVTLRCTALCCLLLLPEIVVHVQVALVCIWQQFDMLLGHNRRPSLHLDYSAMLCVQ